MMNFIYENQGNNTFLVYEIGAEDELDTMSLGMLTNNSIPGFATAAFTQMDTTKYIKYNVSAKVSAAQLFSGMVNKKRLLGVFTGIVDALLAAEDYMINISSLLLDLEYIFSDVSTCETVVICLPVMDLEMKSNDVSMFFKSIVFNTLLDPTENCDYVAKILNYLNSNPVLSLSDFKELLSQIGKSEEPTKAAELNTAAAGVSASTQNKTQPVVTPAQPPEKRTSVQTQVKIPPKHENLQADTNYSGAGQPVTSANTEGTATVAQPAAPKEKPMSMFYLLQHYNKENAAMYKAQKAAQKAKKASTKAQVTPPAQPKTSSRSTASAGFPVPEKTETSNTGFPIPGQQPAVPQTTAKPDPQPPVVKSEAALVEEAKRAAQVPPTQVPNRPLNFGETTVLGAGVGETTVLSSAAETVKNDPHLIRIKNNEKIPLNKPVFRIGKERSYVDYFISDNTAISRGHANIVNHNGVFFVVDTNSTNHTYVNGTMIQSGVETKLSHGDKVRLANEDFEFRMY